MEQKIRAKIEELISQGRKVSLFSGLVTSKTYRIDKIQVKQVFTTGNIYLSINDLPVEDVSIVFKGEMYDLLENAYNSPSGIIQEVDKSIIDYLEPKLEEEAEVETE